MVGFDSIEYDDQLLDIMFEFEEPEPQTRDYPGSGYNVSILKVIPVDAYYDEDALTRMIEDGLSEE